MSEPAAAPAAPHLDHALARRNKKKAKRAERRITAKLREAAAAAGAAPAAATSAPAAAAGRARPPAPAPAPAATKRPAAAMASASVGEGDGDSDGGSGGGAGGRGGGGGGSGGGGGGGGGPSRPRPAVAARRPEKRARLAVVGPAGAPRLVPRAPEGRLAAPAPPPPPQRPQKAAAPAAPKPRPAAGPMAHHGGARAAAAPPPGRMSALQESFRKRLDAGQFRFLNEQLYTLPSRESHHMFQDDPHLFDVYHRGYRDQVAKWPVNPLDTIISLLRKLPHSAVVADFGCGEARLAVSVPQTVHSFDLVALNERVVACDVAHTPLAAASVDACVMCLSLMGTNFADFLVEAKRVLRPSGRAYVAEVRSRFAGEGAEAAGDGGGGAGWARDGGDGDVDDAGLKQFAAYMRALGFRQVSCDARNKMFVLFEFANTERAPDAKAARALAVALKACVYKKR